MHLIPEILNQFKNTIPEIEMYQNLGNQNTPPETPLEQDAPQQIPINPAPLNSPEPQASINQPNEPNTPTNNTNRQSRIRRQATPNHLIIQQPNPAPQDRSHSEEQRNLRNKERIDYEPMFKIYKKSKVRKSLGLKAQNQETEPPGS